jgi:hypothetical protein
MLVSFLAYSLTLNNEATYSSETSFDFQRITWRYIPEDKIIQGKFIAQIRKELI